MCPSAGAIGAFKLLSDRRRLLERVMQSRKQLQRLYANRISSTQAELQEHLERIEEAKRRDHRVLGKQLELFTINPVVGSGLGPCGSPKGP